MGEQISKDKARLAKLKTTSVSSSTNLINSRIIINKNNQSKQLKTSIICEEPQ